MNFVTDYLRGTIKDEDAQDVMDTYIEAWHVSETRKSLHQYLGLRREEYKDWIELKKDIKTILKNRLRE